MLVTLLQFLNALFGSEVSPVQFSSERSTYLPELLKAVLRDEILSSVVIFVTSMSYDETALFVGKLLKAF